MGTKGKFRHLVYTDRIKIEAYRKAGKSPAYIAKEIGCSLSTIYRELKRGETAGEDGAPILDRNRRRAYNPVVAQQKVQASFRRRGRTPADGLQGGFDGDAI